MSTHPVSTVRSSGVESSAQYKEAAHLRTSYSYSFWFEDFALLYLAHGPEWAIFERTW